MNKISIVVMLLTSVLISACGSLRPAWFGEAVIAHQSFPTLSTMVGECIADKPLVKEAIKPDFNNLVDKWKIASDLEPDQLLIKVAGAKYEVASAKASWVNIRAILALEEVDCGPAVGSMVAQVESLFSELETSVLQNQRAVYALEYGALLANIITGRGGTVDYL